jgi:fatty-acyl-CoA synthase
VQMVIEDKKRGLVAQIDRHEGIDEATVTAVLGNFVRPWEFLPKG